MSIVMSRSACCGLRLVSNIEKVRDPKDAMLDMCARMFTSMYGPFDAAFILFSDESPNGIYANRLCQFIIDNKLGTIKQSIQNGTRTYIWEIARRNTRQWYKHNR